MRMGIGEYLRHSLLTGTAIGFPGRDRRGVLERAIPFDCVPAVALSRPDRTSAQGRRDAHGLLADGSEPVHWWISNPFMGGFILHLSEDEVHRLDLSVEDGISSLISVGVAVEVEAQPPEVPITVDEVTETDS